MDRRNKRIPEWIRTLKIAVLHTLPVMAGYVVLGFGFGILSEKNGYGVWWVLAMSTFIYAGSMQYVTIGLLTSSASLITAALTTLMINARHVFYGISMILPYKHTGKIKPYLIFALTDETYSLVCTGDCPKGIAINTYRFLVSLCNHLYWIGGSVLGAVVGAAIPFNTAGIDFAMTALFITVFVDQWKSTRHHLPAIIGVSCSVVCLLIFGADRFLIPSMLLITLLLSLGKPFLSRKEDV